MDLAHAQAILSRYQRELDREGRARALGGNIDRPINLLAFPPEKQIALAEDMVAIFAEHGFTVP